MIVHTSNPMVFKSRDPNGWKAQRINAKIVTKKTHLSCSTERQERTSGTDRKNSTESKCQTRTALRPRKSKGHMLMNHPPREPSLNTTSNSSQTPKPMLKIPEISNPMRNSRDNKNRHKANNQKENRRKKVHISQLIDQKIPSIHCLKLKLWSLSGRKKET